MEFTLKELKVKPIWVQWRYTDRKGKITKMPVDAKNGKPAKSNEPETWSSFGVCRFYLKRNNCDGVGMNFAPVNDDFSIFGIDIDGHNSGSNNLAQELLDLFKDTYCEMSPSGSGYHIIGLMKMSRLPEGYKEKYYQKNAEIEVECYISGQTNRYFTFTGDAIQGRENTPVSDVTDNLMLFLDKYMKRKPAKSSRIEPRKKPYKSYNDKKYHYASYDSIEAMLTIARNAKNGAKFSHLYDLGDVSEYDNDYSRADLALCCMLAFYLDGDIDKIDEAFRDSALYRSKWERKDYSMYTMKRAIEICNGEFFHSR